MAEGYCIWKETSIPNNWHTECGTLTNANNYCSRDAFLESHTSYCASCGRKMICQVMSDEELHEFEKYPELKRLSNMLKLRISWFTEGENIKSSEVQRWVDIAQAGWDEFLAEIKKEYGLVVGKK